MSFKNVCVILVLFQYITISIDAKHSVSPPHKHARFVSQHLPSFECTDECEPSTISKDAQCNYIKSCCQDTLGDILFNYLTMQYCDFETKPIIGAILLCTMLFYAFWIISSLADDYFAPTMEILAGVLGISDDLAGVTIVAFGNGAPDISTSVNAILEGGNTAKLGVSALLGAALFGPIIISGIIAVVCDNPKVSATALLRDCFFLFIAVGMVLIITGDEKVTIAEAIGMIVVYICYVGSVVAREIYKKWWRQKKIRRKTSSLPYHTDAIMPIVGAVGFDRPITHLFGATPTPTPRDRNEFHKKHVFLKEEAMITIIKDPESETTEGSSMDIIDKTQWKRSLITILRAPKLLIEIATAITIPLVNEHWNDYIAIVSCTTAPIFIQWAFVRHSVSEYIADTIPIVAVVAICGCAMSIFTYLRIKRKYAIAEKDETETIQTKAKTEEEVPQLLINGESIPLTLDNLNTSDSEESQEEVMDVSKKPVMKGFFLFLSLASAIAWFAVIANELVNLLTTIGILSTIHLSLLGLTISSWGISLTDLSADVSVARRGFAKMGIAAAIGGATFNLLIGIGVSTTIQTLSSSNGEVAMPNTIHIVVACISVMLGITIYAIWVAANQWTLKRPFGYWCFAYYAAFLIMIVIIYYAF